MAGRSDRHLKIFGGLFFVCMAMTAQASAAPSPDQEIDFKKTKGAVLFNDGDYAAAAALLKEVVAVRPGDTRAAYLLGAAENKQGKLDAAEAHLLSAISGEETRDSIRGPAYLELGTLYHRQKRYSNALAALKNAEDFFSKNGAEPTEMALIRYYRGRAYQSTQQQALAIPLFLEIANGSTNFSPELALTARYHLGVSYYRQGDIAKARDAFETVLRTASRSKIGQSSQTYLAQMARTGGGQDKPWGVTLRLGVEYDDNVPLSQANTGIASPFGNRGDTRHILYFSGRALLKQWGDSRVGIVYAHSQSTHQDLDAFDMRRMEPGLYFTRTGGPVEMRVDYRFNHVDVGDENYLQRHRLRPSLWLGRGDKTQAELSYEIQVSDFKNSALFPNSEGRSGNNHLVGAKAWRYVFGENVLLHGGYTLDVNHADDDAWAYLGHRIFFGPTLSLPGHLRAVLHGEYALRNYDNQRRGSTISNDRDDRTIRLQATLSRPLATVFDFAVRYAYVRNDSNLSIFDYRRNTYGIYVSVHF